MFITFITAIFGAVFDFLAKVLAKVITAKLKKAIAKVLLQCLIKGYSDTNCTCGAEDAADQKASRDTLEVTVKVQAGKTVTVKVQADDSRGCPPEEEALTERCRLPMCRQRLIRLLKAAAQQ
jgi:hypothetical protein